MKQWMFALALVSLIPSVAFAINLNLNYPEFGGFDLNNTAQQSLPAVVLFFYYLIVGVAGLAAFVMLVWGGVQWLVSGAAPSQASEARDKVRNAIIGLLLVLSSFLIIEVINPGLTIIGTGDPSLVGQSSGTTKIYDSPGAVPLGVNFYVESPQRQFANPRPGETLKFFWSASPASSVTGCVGQADPLIPNWEGTPKDFPSGEESITFDNAGSFSLRLRCFWTGNRDAEESVFINVTDDPVTPSADPPSVVLQIGVGSQAEFDANTLSFDKTATGVIGSGDIVAFRWVSSNTVQCALSGERVNYTDTENDASGLENFGTIESWFAGTYSYVITCVSSDGRDALDSATLIVVE